MNTKMNIGVFPCGSEVGLEIHRSLKHYRHFNLIGLSSLEDNGIVTYENYIGHIPFIKSSGFISEMKKVIKKHDILFLIPAMDEVGFVLKENEIELGCEIVYPELRVAKIIRKKSSTYKKLCDIINTPKVFTSRDEIIQSLPIFVKPDIGYGSRGAYKVTSLNEVEDYLNSDNIYLEYLPGNEFTIDCFSSSNNELLFSGARKRARVRMGISVSSTQVEDQNPFQEIAEKINKKLNLTGIWFFQLKVDNQGQFCLLEVAGRVSGSMALYRGIGVNFIALELFRRLGNKIGILKNDFSDIKLERSFDCHIYNIPDFDIVYCDFDDCLIVSDRVNYSLLGFLYKCFDEGKELVLLTRHKHLPQESLNNYRIHENLFHKIIHITDKKIMKSQFIDNSVKSIFIDDSYKERADVQSKRNSYVFAPDAIDLIISKKY